MDPTQELYEMCHDLRRKVRRLEFLLYVAIALGLVRLPFELLGGLI
jgi:hypothetical protein